MFYNQEHSAGLSVGKWRVQTELRVHLLRAAVPAAGEAEL